jgi:hemerythrin-like domain-containing protein
MHSSIEHLRAEHERLIELIHAADDVADRVLHGVHVDAAVIRGLTEFFMLYVHGIHREKEEDIFFPLLNSKGMHHPGGCVGVMLAEHDESQEAFTTMERAAELYERGAEEAANAWSRAARIYCTQLRMHMRRENDVVFAQAERALSVDDDAQLTKAFARVDEKARVNGIVERLSAAEQDAQRFIA